MTKSIKELVIEPAEECSLDNIKQLAGELSLSYKDSIEEAYTEGGRKAKSLKFFTYQMAAILRSELRKEFEEKFLLQGKEMHIHIVTYRESNSITGSSTCRRKEENQESHSLSI